MSDGASDLWKEAEQRENAEETAKMVKKKRQRKMSDRRRAVVATRKAEVAELKDARFAEIADMIAERLEPRIKLLVQVEVARAVTDLAKRQLQSDAPCIQRP